MKVGIAQKSPPHIKMALWLLICFVPIACSSAARMSDSSEWTELSFVIDADVEVYVKVPPAKMAQELHDLQFVPNVDESGTRLFIASYDPGWGRDRGLLLTLLSGVVTRIEKETGSGSHLTLEDIKNEIYLPHKDAGRRFEFVGEQIYSGRSWLKINLLGKPHGVVYASPINNELVLTLSMTVYGKDANETRLFRNRQKTLEATLSSVQVSKVEIQ